MSTSTSQSDRRAFGRRPTHQHAIAHMTGRAPLRCVVRDISEGGALLEFGEPVVLPYRLRLVWEGTGDRAECEVRHVQGTKAGVQFICSNGARIARQSIALNNAETQSPPPPAPALKPVRPADAKAAGSLVRQFRTARQPVAPVAAVFFSASVPLPLPACAYAEAAAL